MISISTEEIFSKLSWWLNGVNPKATNLIHKMIYAFVPAVHAQTLSHSFCCILPPKMTLPKFRQLCLLKELFWKSIWPIHTNSTAKLTGNGSCRFTIISLLCFCISFVSFLIVGHTHGKNFPKRVKHWIFKTFFQYDFDFSDSGINSIQTSG